MRLLKNAIPMILSLLVSLLLRPTFNSCSIEADESLKDCKIEYRQSGGKWISAEPFMGSLLNLEEDTRYEVRFRDGKEILAKEFSESASRVTGLPVDMFYVLFNERKADNVGVGGVLLSNQEY